MDSGVGGHNRGNRSVAPPRLRGPAGLLLPVVAAGLATAIFLVDAVGQWDISIEILYVVVILLAARFLRGAGILLVAIGCAGLTTVGFLLDHDQNLLSANGVRRLVAILAIGITSRLAVRNEDAPATVGIYGLIGRRLPLPPEIDAAPTRPGRREGKSSYAQRLTEQQLHAAIDAIPTHIWTLHADGSTDYLNRRRLEYTGPDVDFLAIIHPHDRPAHDDLWATALATGSAIQLEVRLRRFDGAYRWFLFRAEPQRDIAGRIIKWFGTNTDIDDLRRAQEALGRSEAYLADAQRLSKTGSLGWRGDGSRTFWSEETYRIFGYDRSVDPSMERVFDRVHPDDVDQLRQAIERARHELSDMNVELRMVAADGAAKQLRILARPMTPVMGESEFIGAVTDITNAKQAEEALQRARADLAHVTRVATLGELTASIAHEVNQPLTGIVTNGEACLRWLRRDVPDLQEAERAVERVVDDGRRAGEVVRRLRALARKDEPRRLPIDLNEVVEESLPLVRHEFSRYRIALELELSPRLPPILGDRVQLQQVVINLIVNGIQAMADVTDRPSVLTISSRVDEADADAETEVTLAVGDSGVGVAPGSNERVFDAFFTTRTDGMGMGLSICRSIIEAHGGRIWLAAKSAPGAVFLLALPAHREVSRLPARTAGTP